MRRFICVLLVVVLCVGLMAGCGNKVDEYNQKLYDFQRLSLDGGAEAETVGNMVKAIWYNTIYDELDAKTEKYTHVDFEVNEDFNTSLALYFVSDEYKDGKKRIEENLKEVDKAYLELTNPPEDCKEGYKIVTTLYEQYEKLTNIATNPSGNLQSYSEAFNSADTEYMNSYRKLERYFEAVEFTPDLAVKDS